MVRVCILIGIPFALGNAVYLAARGPFGALWALVLATAIATGGLYAAAGYEVKQMVAAGFDEARIERMKQFQKAMLLMPIIVFAALLTSGVWG
ncbi:MAG: hypothetical protein AAGD23_03665 [Pseudomonadota bacterium]